MNVRSKEVTREGSAEMAEGVGTLVHRRDDLPALTRPRRLRLVFGGHVPETPRRRATLSARDPSRPMPGTRGKVVGAAEAGVPLFYSPPGVQVHPSVVGRSLSGGGRGRGRGYEG
jgi:hypothetical protein